VADAMHDGKLMCFQIAFSREENRQYVMDLIQQDGEYFADLLKNKGVIMICGSLNMQKDVEKVIADIASKNGIVDYEDRILTDCY
jgi:sulfite reductase (NADPH) flavoprotein alpha-component